MNVDKNKMLPKKNHVHVISFVGAFDERGWHRFAWDNPEQEELHNLSW